MRIDAMGENRWEGTAVPEDFMKCVLIAVAHHLLMMRRAAFCVMRTPLVTRVCCGHGRTTFVRPTWSRSSTSCGPSWGQTLLCKTLLRRKRWPRRRQRGRLRDWPATAGS
jgi:hypothetical protein